MADTILQDVILVLQVAQFTQWQIRSIIFKMKYND